MSDKTVFLATPTYPPEIGGASTYYSQIADILKESEEYEPVVLSNYDEDNIIDYDEDDMPVIRICTDDITEIPDVANPLRYVDIELGLEPDLLHLHPNLQGIGLILSGFFPGEIPVVYDCRGSDYTVDNLTTKKVGAYVSSFLSITEEVDEALKSRANASEDLIFRSPVIIDTDDVGKRYSQQPDSFRLVFVSDLHRHKGLPIAIEVIKNLSPKFDIELVIVGDGDDEELARAADDELYNVEYVGRLDHEDALAEIDAADALIAPSAIETGEGPRAILEALELDTPVISTDKAKIRDNIGDAGIIADRDVKSFCHAVHIMISYYGTYSSNADDASPLSTSIEQLRTNIMSAYDTALNS